MKEIKAIKKPRGTKRKEGRKKIILRIPSKVLYHSEQVNYVPVPEAKHAGTQATQKLIM